MYSQSSIFHMKEIFFIKEALLSLFLNVSLGFVYNT